jgi:nitrite reductase (NAD(P)H)
MLIDQLQYSSFDDGAFNYHINTRVTEILPQEKKVRTSTNELVAYDILVLATGSDAVLPERTPGYDANGVFVYRTISDLERLIEFAAHHGGETGVVVGGGLLGLEAAKAMTDLQHFGKVTLIDRNRYVLSRQLDSDAGNLVTEKIRELGLDVMLQKRVGRIETDEGDNVIGITFEDGESTKCCCICFAVCKLEREL